MAVSDSKCHLLKNINLLKIKLYIYELLKFTNLKRVFACWIFILELLKLKVHPVNASRSLHGLQTLLYSCDHFGCELCQVSIQNHAKDRFQVFAHCHLTWLCCAIGIWADTYYFWPFFRHVAGSNLQAMHRIWFGTCWFLPVLYFPSETNEWSEEWANPQAQVIALQSKPSIIFWNILWE